MEAVFLRHASRASLHSPSALNFDGGLSDRGKAEAAALAQAVGGSVPEPTHLLCSPKRRARETVAPLAMAFGLAAEAEPVLDERGDSETGLRFETRVRTFVDELPNAFEERSCVWICSHLDWLERAMLFLPSDLSEDESLRPFSCAEARLFRWQAGVWRSIGHIRGRGEFDG